MPPSQTPCQDPSSAHASELVERRYVIFSALLKASTPRPSKYGRILPRAIRTARITATRKLRRTVRLAPNNDLLPDLHNPLTLQQLRRARPPPRILLETSLQELMALGAQLIFRRQLWRVALRNIIHNRPFVVQGRPRAAAGAHLEDDAAERPDVDGALAAFILAFDDFGGHVHRGAGHGFLLAGDPGARAATDGRVVGLEGFALTGDDFGSAEVDIFDYAVVVEEDV